MEPTKPSNKITFEQFDKNGNMYQQIQLIDFNDEWASLSRQWSDLYHFAAKILGYPYLEKCAILPGDEHVHMLLNTSSSAGFDSAEQALERCLNKLPKEKVKKILKRNGF